MNTTSHQLLVTSFLKNLSDPSKMNYYDIQSSIDNLIDNLPILSNTDQSSMLNTMKKVCLIQEHDIQSKMKEYRQFDIYEEINKVCDDLKNLKYMSEEELNIKFQESQLKMISLKQENYDVEKNNLDIKMDEENNESKIDFPNYMKSSENSSENELNDSFDENTVIYEKIDDEEETFKHVSSCAELSNLTKKTKKLHVDFNKIHNILDENENICYHGLHHSNELNILKEIDMNEGNINIRLFD